MCFIDYQKAFDNVEQDQVLEKLREIGIDDKDIRIIKEPYWNQTAEIHVNIERSLLEYFVPHLC